MDLLWKYSITCRDSLGQKHYYITHAVDDAHAQTRFFNDRETKPGKYGDWQPGDIDLIET